MQHGENDLLCVDCLNPGLNNTNKQSCEIYRNKTNKQNS